MRRALSDEDHSAIEQIWQMAWRLGFYRGGPVFMSAISGIDIALWDLKGKSHIEWELSHHHHHIVGSSFLAFYT
jgi:L-alanine-DL-glutamate epimerase-like enolase superfamily enzyme